MSSEIRPKSCTYGCGVEIYWNTDENTYWELYSRKKHVCPNRMNTKKPSVISPPATAAKPTYYNKKGFANPTITKPKMDNSFEFLTGSPESIKIQYEYLSDLVRDLGGKVHGSQSHIIAANNTLQLIVYYEVPAEGKRDEVKQKFNNVIQNIELKIIKERI